ncbi:MAG: glutamate formimidoyltransferase [Solirubrobacteraceae bacterium]
MSRPTLLAVPNVSEGRDHAVLGRIGEAFQRDGIRLLDRHVDPDHHRAVFTLAGPPGELAQAVASGAEQAVALVDLRTPRGLHPHVGALDVAPIVYADPMLRGAACAEALLLGDLIGQLGVPVYMYGELAAGRSRAELRRGGVAGLAARATPSDFGPVRPHPSAGASLVAARPPLVAFNLELAAPAGLESAREIASLIREGGAEGLPGVRAIGLSLPSRGDIAQVSMNIEGPLPLERVIAAVRRHAQVARAELVGLAPRAAWEGFPRDVEVPGFEPRRHLLENALEG